MKTKVKKVPVILQMEALECGAASLAMILAYYKKYISLEKLRVDCNISRDGSSAKYIVLAAKHHGLKAKAFKMSVEKCKSRTDFPMIIHWNFNHFVVLCGFQKDKAVINDPAGGRVLVTMEEFDKSFTGIAMTFEPGEEFEPSGKQENVGGFLKERLHGAFPILLAVTLLGLMISVLQAVNPVFYRIFVDRVLIGQNTEWMRYVLIGMLFLAVCSFVIEALEYTCLSRLKAKLSISSSASFMWHVLRLPVEFFSQRFTGDIAARQKSNHEIADVLCTKMIPVVLNAVMILIYIFVMLAYHPGLTLLGIFVAAMDIAMIQVNAKRYQNTAKNMQRDAGKLSGMTSACISMMETIKASGAEYGFFEKISGYQAKYHNSLLQSKQMDVYLNAVPSLLSGIGDGLILLIGVSLIFNGSFSIGMLLAFQGYMGLFMTPVNAVISSMQAYQEMSGNMERIEDVMKYETDVEIDFSEKKKEDRKLSGKVELKNLVFGYSPLASPLIQDFSVTAEPGSMTAFVGGSGSGKSTLAKIISGLYQPWQGELLFDGEAREAIDRYVFTGSVAVVDQSISLFSGTIRENITMWDDSIPEEVIVQACKDACIHDDIMARKGGYDYLISEGGTNFSGGQRQRIEIARAFAANPSILILDEATSALDPYTEKKVMDAVRERNITCFVIAHRLSTIRDADEIILLEYGEEVERGTHEELLALDGKYAELIRCE